MILQNVLIISDVEDEDFYNVLKEKYPNSVIFSPSKPIKHCIGCLSCWFKTPGKCFLDDSFSHMGKYMSECDMIVYVSRCFFGGFSPFVKNVIDRSISYVQPGFKKRGSRTGHFRRYKNKFEYLAVFYGEDITDEEKSTATGICEGNALLWNCRKPQIRFCSDYKEAEALLL